MVEVQTRPSGFTKRLNSPWPSTLLVRDLLLCAGLALSPATSIDDRAAWAFLVEHAGSIHPRPGRLRIVDESKHWDARIQTLFSERLGAGLTVWHLWRQFGVVHIADVAPFLSRAIADPSNPFHGKQVRLLNTHGQLRPDFICLTRSLDAVLAESKGSFGAPGVFNAAVRTKAKNQLNNLQPVGVSLRADENRLAFGTNLRRTSESVQSEHKDTGVYVDDPDGDERPLNFDAAADEVVIHAYSKLLQFLGLGFEAYLLRRGIRPLLRNPDERNVIEVRQEPVLVLQDLFGFRFGLPVSLAEGLFNEPERGVAERVGKVLEASTILRQLDRQSREPGGASEDLFVLPNGLVAVRS